ncbi:MAG: hypothetical protein GY822_13495 [Deltaproteobacteria bacterium]|nr:hypothetical protein [Deltaproteobacteria bacterium]
MSQNTEFILAIRQFIELQSALFESFCQDNTGEISSNEFHPDARLGVICVNDKDWNWNIHGTGVLFTSSLLVKVDIHEVLTKSVYFDQYRLRTYFGSLGKKGVQMLERIVGHSGPLDELIDLAIDGAGNKIVEVEPNVFMLRNPCLPEGDML